jgi:hypothetical protein
MSIGEENECREEGLLPKMIKSPTKTKGDEHGGLS